MNNEKQFQLRKKAAIISLFVGFGMFIAKIGAYFLTGSAAIFSDAAESVVHVLATSMALYSIILSSKPADDSHRYGHGNVEYFSAGVEGTLIVIAAVVIIYTAMNDIINGIELKSLNVGILMVLITGFDLFDPLVAIVVALNIVNTGVRLMRQSIGGLMLETNPAIIKELSDTLVSIKKDFWIDLHELRYWKSGDKIFIDFHLLLPFYFTIEQSHKEEKRIEMELKNKYPTAQIKIHFDYCNFELCRYCDYQDCEKRKDKKSILFEWNTEKLTGKAVYKVVH